MVAAAGIRAATAMATERKRPPTDATSPTDALAPTATEQIRAATDPLGDAAVERAVPAGGERPRHPQSP